MSREFSVMRAVLMVCGMGLVASVQLPAQQLLMQSDFNQGCGLWRPTAITRMDCLHGCLEALVPIALSGGSPPEVAAPVFSAVHDHRLRFRIQGLFAAAGTGVGNPVAPRFYVWVAQDLLVLWTAGNVFVYQANCPSGGACWNLLAQAGHAALDPSRFHDFEIVIQGSDLLVLQAGATVLAVRGSPEVSSAVPAPPAWRAYSAGRDGFRLDDVLVESIGSAVGPPGYCPTTTVGASLRAETDAAGVFHLTLCSQSPGAPVFVLGDSLLGQVSLWPYGYTQLAMSPHLVPLADPTGGTFGPPIFLHSRTDSGGRWHAQGPAGALRYLFPGSTRAHFEAYVLDFTAPNGLFFQTAVASHAVP